MQKYSTARRLTDVNIIRHMCIACCVTKATDTHSEYVNTYSFSTAKMVTRTLLNVTLYVHCLPSYNRLTVRSYFITGYFVKFLSHACYMPSMSHLPRFYLLILQKRNQISDRDNTVLNLKAMTSTLVRMTF